ncbi:MAG: putative glycoside hydrolase [Brevinematia bacterium]
MKSILFLLFFMLSGALHSNGMELKDEGEIEDLLIGTENGVYIKSLSNFEKLELLDGKKILKIEKSPAGYYFLCEEGVAFSSNLIDVEWLTNGIKRKKFIDFSDGFVVKEKPPSFNNIKIDEDAPQNLILFGKKEIYLSTNYGKKWVALNPSLSEFNSAEISTSKDSIIIYLIHPYRGIYFKNLKNGRLFGIKKGLEKINSYYEDFSDINFYNDKLYTVSTFSKDIYRFDFDSKRWVKFENITNLPGMVYGFTPYKDRLFFITDSSIKNYKDGKINDFELLQDILNYFYNEKKAVPYSLLLNNELAISSVDVFFSDFSLSPNFLKAIGKKGIYISPFVVRNKKRNVEQLISMVKNKECNAVVLDMKDDFGYLHFSPQNPDIKKIARVSNPVDIEKLVETAKENDIYLIARIVIFKDSVLYRYNNGKFAVMDKTTETPWVGIRTNSDDGELQTNIIREYWVDPYNTEVWKYNVDIACELIKRGFDEIQFDYIRFPTDGLNLSSAYYPAKPEGVNKDEAIFSFLGYARKRIDAPISIDIYGVNGWYRTAARTGQDVELLSKYVDVICPMFYPSHFDQEFLNFEPYEERPFRIYYHGSYRTFFMARKRTLIRPYVQHFKLNVSYDRLYYNENYILNEIRGVEQGLNMGYVFWNMEGKY